MAQSSDSQLSDAWEQKVTIDGKVYFINHYDKTTQWTHPKTGKKMRVPEEFPLGWERKVLENGTIVYVDHQNKTTSYTDPRLEFAFEEKDPEELMQRFDASSTAEEVLHGRDLTGRVAIVTGANSGIGFETARALAKHGVHVVMACRSVERANEAAEMIKQEKSTAKINVLQCDLAELKSVSKFCNEFEQLKLPLHMLILNAAVLYLPHSLTTDGIETTFQVNHLAQFYMTKLFQNKLIESAPARVVVVSSESHRYSKLKRETLTEELLSPVASRNFSQMAAYNDSKLANVLFTNELNQRLSPHKVTANSCHPGNLIGTNLSRNSWLMKFIFGIVRPFVKSLEQGAATTVYCATAMELENRGGRYFNNCWETTASEAARDMTMAGHLWEISEKMIEKAIASSNLL